MSADDDKNPQIEDEGQDDDQEEDEQPTVAPPSGDHKTLEEDEDVLCQMYVIEPIDPVFSVDSDCFWQNLFFFLNRAGKLFIRK
jgi:hypothetical protein